MADVFLLYISAAGDLERERDLLARAVVNIPVTLGWRIVQSPLRGEPADLAAVAQADGHLVLLGSDIRAPIGVEWIASRRVGKRPYFFLKQGGSRTIAAGDFVRHVAQDNTWHEFRDLKSLRWSVLRLLGDYLISRAVYYALQPGELERLEKWREELEQEEGGDEVDLRGVSGENSVILSRERFTPRDGVLIQSKSPSEIEDSQ